MVDMEGTEESTGEPAVTTREADAANPPPAVPPLDVVVELAAVAKPTRELA